MKVPNWQQCLNSPLPLMKWQHMLTQADIHLILCGFIKHLLRQRGMDTRLSSTLPRIPLPNGASAGGDYRGVTMCRLITSRLFGALCHGRLPGNKLGREEEANFVLIQCPRLCSVCMKCLFASVGVNKLFQTKWMKLCSLLDFPQNAGLLLFDVWCSIFMYEGRLHLCCFDLC